MKHLTMGLPTFGFIVGTRIALALGAGLLFSSKLSAIERRRLGKALVLIGAITTIPAARSLRRSLTAAPAGERPPRLTSAIRRDPGLVGATRFPRKGDEDDV